jgi:ABC-2 type transport system permease protein
MKKAILITLNEVKLYLQDKGDLAFSLLLPIVTFALIYGAFGGQTLFKATASVVDEDKGAYAAQLIERLDGIDGISIEMLTPDKARARLDNSDRLFVLDIPGGFSAALDAGRPAQLDFWQRGNGGLEGQILASIIRGLADDMGRGFQITSRVTVNLDGTGVTKDEIDAAVRKYLDQERLTPALGVNEEVVGGTTDLVNQYLPGIVTMYVLFALTMGARAIVEERRRGTLERLLTTRLSVGELFFGKYLAAIGRGFVQTVILLSLAYAVFQMFTPVTFLESLFIILVYTAAASALGLIIASISRTEEAANWTAVVFTMFMVMLGGTFFTVEPGSVFYTLGRMSINSYANEALRKIIAESSTLGDVMVPLAIFIGVGAVALVISRLIFKAVPGGK